MFFAAGGVGVELSVAVVCLVTSENIAGSHKGEEHGIKSFENVVWHSTFLFGVDPAMQRVEFAKRNISSCLSLLLKYLPHLWSHGRPLPTGLFVTILFYNIPFFSTTNKGNA